MALEQFDTANKINGIPQQITEEQKRRARRVTHITLRDGCTAEEIERVFSILGIEEEGLS